jgi:hypothetical protein
MWVQMMLKSRWKWYAGFGVGSFVFGAYLARRTLLYLWATGDPRGAIIFGLSSLGLFVVGVLHLYMAAGIRFGRVDAVTGTREAATLRRGGQIVAEACQIRLVRDLYYDDPSVEPANRYLFFICGYRPWVCAQASFLASGC